MNVEQIRALANNGYLKANRYKLKMALPSSSTLGRKYTNEAMELINSNCNSVNLPGTDISTFEWSSKSAPIKLPYQRTYNPLVLSFYVDKDNLVRQFFEDWINIIWNPETYDFNFLDEYSITLTIEVLNDKNETISTYVVDHCYPLKIDDISVSYADGELQKCTATLTYNTYKLSKT